MEDVELQLEVVVDCVEAVDELELQLEVVEHVLVHELELELVLVLVLVVVVELVVVCPMSSYTCSIVHLMVTPFFTTSSWSAQCRLATWSYCVIFGIYPSFHLRLWIGERFFRIFLTGGLFSFTSPALVR